MGQPRYRTWDSLRLPHNCFLWKRLQQKHTLARWETLLGVPQLSDDPRKRAAEERCLADIREHGTHVLKVFGDVDWPEFAYTIGLFENYGHPELIILGLPGDRAHPILNHARDLVKAGHVFREGAESLEVLERFPVAFRAVPAAQREAHFGWAEWFYGDRPYPALQLVLPDSQGRWPWDPATNSEFRALQPILASEALPVWARSTG